jgi:crotonobetainyl-CoA:carnitine CoA-transferase CaiB-like acyl-CoA transferase
MFETTAQMMLGDHLYGQTFIPPRGGFGYPRLLNPQRRPYATRTAWCASSSTPTSSGRPSCARSARPSASRATRGSPTANRARSTSRRCTRSSADKLKARTTEEWRALLEPLGIPVLPAHTFESLLADPHLQDIGFFQQFEHPTEGVLRTMAVPSEWPQTPLPPLRPPPLLGEHSVQLLAEAGYSRDQIDAMVQTGVTQVTTAPSDMAVAA